MSKRIVMAVLLICATAGAALAAPTGVTVSINKADAQTGSDVVWLYLTASSANPPMEMRFSNWGFGISSQWEPYFQKKLWMLEPAGTLNATKGVTVEVRDATGTTSASDGIFIASPVNLKAVAEKRWYASNLTGSVIETGGGTNPVNFAFDGAHMWVSCYSSNQVKVYDAGSGAYVNTYPAGASPEDLCFDGLHVWVANVTAPGAVTELSAADGSTLNAFTVGDYPMRLCFDGTFVWASCYDGKLYQIKVADGTVTSTDTLGSYPVGIAFDGNNLWVAFSGDNVVKKVRPSDFAVLGTYPVGAQPYGVLFDGANIWVTNRDDDTVTKLRAADGANKGTFPVGDGPTDLVFDGATIWVGNYTGDTVSKLRAADGTPWGTVHLPATSYGPWGLGFDGSNVWATVQWLNEVAKL